MSSQGKRAEDGWDDLGNQAQHTNKRRFQSARLRSCCLSTSGSVSPGLPSARCLASARRLHRSVRSRGRAGNHAATGLVGSVPVGPPEPRKATTGCARRSPGSAPKDAGSIPATSTDHSCTTPRRLRRRGAKTFPRKRLVAPGTVLPRRVNEGERRCHHGREAPAPSARAAGRGTCSTHRQTPRVIDSHNDLGSRTEFGDASSRERTKSLSVMSTLGPTAGKPCAVPSWMRGAVGPCPVVTSAPVTWSRSTPGWEYQQQTRTWFS